MLLSGPPSSGKSACIEALAGLAGARLRHISLTPSTDASEFLGCFEQRSVGGKGGVLGEEGSEVWDAACGLAVGLLAAAGSEEVDRAALEALAAERELE